MAPGNMMYALDEDGNRIEAEPGTRATCEGCSSPVRAHCGPLRRWHWHHESGQDCDPWHEPETDWHIKWKSDWDPEFREVWCPPHRADVRNVSGLVIEFQHSPIGAGEIQEREEFWGNLAWVFDAREWFCNFDVRLKPNKITFRWKHPREALFAAQAPIFLDTGEEMFQITWLSKKVPCGGIGRFMPYRYFLRAMHRARGRASPNFETGQWELGDKSEDI